jgi:hypothetical protein
VNIGRCSLYGGGPFWTGLEKTAGSVRSAGRGTPQTVSGHRLRFKDHDVRAWLGTSVRMPEYSCLDPAGHPGAGAPGHEGRADTVRYAFHQSPWARLTRVLPASQRRSNPGHRASPRTSGEQKGRSSPWTGPLAARQSPQTGGCWAHTVSPLQAGECGRVRFVRGPNRQGAATEALTTRAAPLCFIPRASPDSVVCISGLVCSPTLASCQLGRARIERATP